jgi:hypothetical protein
MRWFPCGWFSRAQDGRVHRNAPRLSVSSGRSVWTTGLSTARSSQPADLGGLVAALAEAVNSLVAEPATAERMGAAGRKRAVGSSPGRRWPSGPWHFTVADQGIL